MRLLIVCQAVDTTHQNLGFFVRWIAEFAKHAEKVIVIANEVGVHDLPSNVVVYSLGKEQGVSRIGRYLRFIAYIVRFSNDYQNVFCHMNPEFVLAGSWWWRLSGKKILLWYVHKSVTLRLRLACLVVDAVCTASKESFRLPFSRVHVLGHGIDTDFFAPDPRAVKEVPLLSVGRLSKSKRHDLSIRASALTHQALRIAGDGPERDTLERLAESERAVVTFLGGLTQEALREQYRVAEHLIHTSETGSMDKVVLEALAMNLDVVTTSAAYEGLPVRVVAPTAESIAEALRQDEPIKSTREVIRSRHSLDALIPQIMRLY